MAASEIIHLCHSTLRAALTLSFKHQFHTGSGAGTKCSPWATSGRTWIVFLIKIRAWGTSLQRAWWPNIAGTAIPRVSAQPCLTEPAACSELSPKAESRNSLQHHLTKSRDFFLVTLSLNHFLFAKNTTLTRIYLVEYAFLIVALLLTCRGGKHCERMKCIGLCQEMQWNKNATVISVLCVSSSGISTKNCFYRGFQEKRHQDVTWN